MTENENSVVVRQMLPNEWPAVSLITKNEGWTNDDDEFLEFIIVKQPDVRSLVAVDSSMIILTTKSANPSECMKIVK